MKEILDRLTAETPKFFKRLRAFGLSLSAAGGAIVAIPGVPENVKHIAGHFIWIGAVVAAVSQLAAQNPEELPSQKGGA